MKSFLVGWSDATSKVYRCWNFGYFLLVYVKAEVYKTHINRLNQLKCRIWAPIHIMVTNYMLTNTHTELLMSRLQLLHDNRGCHIDVCWIVYNHLMQVTLCGWLKNAFSIGLSIPTSYMWDDISTEKMTAIQQDRRHCCRVINSLDFWSLSFFLSWVPYRCSTIIVQ